MVHGSTYQNENFAAALKPVIKLVYAVTVEGSTVTRGWPPSTGELILKLQNVTVTFFQTESRTFAVLSCLSACAKAHPSAVNIRTTSHICSTQQKCVCHHVGNNVLIMSARTVHKHRWLLHMDQLCQYSTSCTSMWKSNDLKLGTCPGGATSEKTSTSDQN